MTFFFNQATVDTTELLGWPPLRLAAGEEGERLLVPVVEIVYLEAEGNHCWLTIQNGQRVLMSKTLKYYQDRLPASWFVRLHRKFTINKLFLSKIEYKNSAYRVVLSTGQSFLISRRRWSQVRQQLLGDQALNSRLIEAFFR